jgi:NAD(P)-dependent dehydrogenase (short-subunit alcohol dehydrogenase family)
MAGQFDGKVALVTGGNAGIGKSAAMQFAREGASVVIAARRVDAGEETVAEIRDAGGEAAFVRTDVSKTADVRNMVNTAVETYGRLDYAFNNAGIVLDRGRTHEHTVEDWDQTIDINLKGLWLCVKYEVEVMLEQGGGAIVNDASTSGLLGGMNRMAYRVSKAGVNMITKVAAIEYAKQGIRVNCVCPGTIHTAILDRMIAESPGLLERASAAEEMGRVGQPDEVAEAVIWLCSDTSSFVNGHIMPIDGGFMAGRLGL